jgi:hypothetical protein
MWVGEAGGEQRHGGGQAGMARGRRLARWSQEEGKLAGGVEIDRGQGRERDKVRERDQRERTKRQGRGIDGKAALVVGDRWEGRSSLVRAGACG